MTRLLTYAKSNAIALLALLVALGGTSYAAIAIPAGSVGTRQLRNRAVTEKKLGARAVGAANLNSKSIAGYVAFWAHVGANWAGDRIKPARERHQALSRGRPSDVAQADLDRLLRTCQRHR
jgi:hypothetical protein